jgi:hypothetical protein
VIILSLISDYFAFLDLTTNEIILLIMELVFVFLWSLNISHFARRRKTDKSKVVLYILLTSIFYTFGVIQAVDILGLDQWSEPKFGFKLSAAYGVAVIFSTLASFFFYAFGLEVFGKDPRKARRNKFWFGILDFPAGILVCLGKIMKIYPPWTQNVFGLMPLYDLLFFLGFGIHLILTFYLGIFLFVNFNKVAKYSDTRIERVSFRLMSISGVSVVVSYILWVVEGLNPATASEVSPIGIAGWGVALLISVSMYLGYAQPKFFKKMFEERTIHIRT